VHAAFAFVLVAPVAITLLYRILTPIFAHMTVKAIPQ
jgi:hypothetical protein